MTEYAAKSGTGWRRAAETVALRVNEEHADSIVRSLNRRNKTARGSSATVQYALSPGIGVLYKRISTAIEQMNAEVESLQRVDALFVPLAEKAKVMRDVLEERLRLLAELEDTEDNIDPIFQQLASVDSFFERRTLIQADRDEVLGLTQMLSHLQHQIEILRPNSKLFKY